MTAKNGGDKTAKESLERPHKPQREKQLKTIRQQNQSSRKRDNTTKRKEGKSWKGPQTPKGWPKGGGGAPYQPKQRKGNSTPRRKTKPEPETQWVHKVEGNAVHWLQEEIEVEHGAFI